MAPTATANNLIIADSQGRRKNLLVRFLQPKSSLIEPIHVDNSNSPLLRLPGELRTLIWDFAFTLSTEERLKAVQYFPKSHDAFSLILTCKQIRHELGDLPYLSDVFVISPAARFDRTRDHQPGWMDFAAGFVLRKPRSLPPALQARPETVKCIAIGFSLFTRIDASTLPVDNLIDSNVLRKAGVKPKEFIMKICVCAETQGAGAAMSFCIVFEKLAMHFPTIERIVVYHCTKGVISPNSHSIAKDFPSLITGSHIVRSSSGASWSVRQDSDSNGKKVKMSWVAAPHPGESMDAVTWTSRTVDIEYHDSEAVSGVGCLRDRGKAIDIRASHEEVPEREEHAATVKPKKKAISKWSSALKEKLLEEFS